VGFLKSTPVAILLLVFSVLRVGEASHPGPAADDHNFFWGIANPTGLRSKATYVVEHMAYGVIWAFSETHLSSREVLSFNSGLRFAESAFQSFLGGYPVPPSNDNTGSWEGVGVLSKTPVRHIPHSWPDGVMRSSRAMAFTTLVDDVWMTGGVVYGEPDSQHYPARLVHNEALLQAVTSSVGFLSTGPRFVAGDWNVTHGELPVFSTLARSSSVLPVFFPGGSVRFLKNTIFQKSSRQWVRVPGHDMGPGIKYHTKKGPDFFS